MRSARPSQSMRIALAVLVGVAGCSTVKEPPVTARLVDLQVTDATLFETMAVFDVRLDNASPDDLTVTGATYRLKLDGRAAGQGLSGETVAVPRFGSAIQRVQANLGNLTLARTLMELAERGRTAYSLDGTLYVTGADGRKRSFRLTRTGVVDLTHLNTGAVPAP